MQRRQLLVAAGLCLAIALVGCPRSKLPGQVDPKSAQEARAFPPPPPWKVPSDAVARLAVAGLPRVSNAHSGSFHLHAGLRIFYQGQSVTVPAGIGLDKYGDPVSPVHTHRAKGVLHVEFTEPRAFTLGQFFTLWGVPLAKATVLVDQVPVSDAEGLVLADGQQIVVLFGAAPSAPLAWPKAPEVEAESDPDPTPSPVATPTAAPPEATESATPEAT